MCIRLLSQSFFSAGLGPLSLSLFPLPSCAGELQTLGYRDFVPTPAIPAQAPSFTTNPHNQDVYSAYNKPEAVIDWLAHNEVS